jgi:tyrosine-specific transport protein
MVSAQRKAQQANNHPSGYVVKGGSLSLAIVTIIGIIIITAQLLQMIGIIPAVG